MKIYRDDKEVVNNKLKTKKTKNKTKQKEIFIICLPLVCLSSSFVNWNEEENVKSDFFSRNPQKQIYKIS